ncbi:hypothetical protein [Pseudomonas poae]|uniref:hypothetical protein n=1 Tax=Pseudomonas poae TaxID=200451 RepID=UPI0012E37DC5|nr:hypothetical protein [Pseudomonas poae]
MFTRKQQHLPGEVAAAQADHGFLSELADAWHSDILLGVASFCSQFRFAKVRDV